MLEEHRSVIMRSLVGILFSAVSLGSLMVSLLYFTLAGLGDPPGPDPVAVKNEMMLRAVILVVVLLLVFLFSIILGVLWSLKKRWSGITILALSVLQLIGLVYLHFNLGLEDNLFLWVIFLLMPALVDITVITLLSLSLFRKSVKPGNSAPA